MSPKPKIGPLPKCPQNCNWSTAWCLKSILQDATTATSYIIDNFGMRDLFGRDNYEYYARLTGRILKVTPNEYCQKKGPVLILCLQVEDEWIFFTYPLDCLGIRSDLDLDLRNRRSANPWFFENSKQMN